MSVTRRDFLASAGAAAVAGAFARAAGLRARQQAPAPYQTLFAPLRRNTGYFIGRGGTIGYLVNRTGTVVVDAQYPDSAQKFLDGLKLRSEHTWIDVLFNTHHHADHTAGNVVFKPVTKKIVANENVPRLQTLAAQQAATPTPQVFASTTFRTAWKVSVGDEQISAAYFGPAHTGGDSVYYFERANVVHVGDLVWNRLQTFVDRPGGASAVHWITVVERIATTYPEDAIFICGHAGPKAQVQCTKADVLLMRDYLTALVEFVRAGIAAGKPRDVVVKSTDLLKGLEAFGPLTSRALEGTYDELTVGAGTMEAGGLIR